MKRNALAMAGAACAAIAMAFATLGFAQNFPTRPVTLIVPWPAGGTTDVGKVPLKIAKD